jgi:membrane dipeptidase
MAAIGLASLATPAISFAADRPVGAQAPSRSGAEQALVARARGIHDRVITLDTHDDIDVDTFTASCNYTMRLTTQVNLPKMREGGLDVSFMIVYVGQGPLTPEGFDSAYREAVAKFDAVHRLTEVIAPKEIGLALTPADVRRIARTGRKVAVIGIENGYPIGTDIGRVKEFWTRGGRYLSLAHNGHSQLADSNSGEATNTWLHNGLSELGRQAIAEMNRWGIMIDLSHPSKQANLQAMALSRAPVIASHSAARALANHSRNLDDEQLTALRKNGGVIQTVAFAGYVKVEDAAIARARQQAIAALNQEFGLTATGRGAGGAAASGAPPCPVEVPSAGIGRGAGAGAATGAAAVLSEERRAEYERRLAQVQATHPTMARATVKDFVDHIDYLVKKVGIDHVGISSDFDGGGGIDGWASAAESFNVTLELVRRGYSEAQIGKIWSGNLLRVWTEVEQVAKRIQTEDARRR